MEATHLHRTFIYHSPQYPGFTSWCGLWTMRDDSVMCCFTQATGPFAGRPQAPVAVRRRLVWPPLSAQGEPLEAYDMTGLDLANVHLRSRDGGRTWEHVASDHFVTCMNGITGEAQECLPGGQVLRGVWGPYLPYDDDGPDDGYMQRSTDGCRTWGPPEAIGQHPGHRFWPKRIRVLADGRALTGGGLFPVDLARDTRTDWSAGAEPALFVTPDDGRTWSGPVRLVPDPQVRQDLGLTEEFDWAELPDGDLLVVLRADHAPGGPRRLQTRLTRRGDSWVAGPVTRAPFPHSGHPELLATRAGVVLHVATSGISWTVDAGASWQALALEDGLRQLRNEPATGYYPKAVQLADGQVLVVGHVGGDNGYGMVDQAIVGVQFRLLV